MRLANSAKAFRINVIAHGLIVQIPAPVNVDRSGNVTGIVKEHVFVAFNDSHLRIVQVRGNPFRADQCFRMSVFGGGHIGEITQTNA